MFTTDLGNLYNRNIFKTSLYIYIFQDEKCRLMRNLSLSMGSTVFSSICDFNGCFTFYTLFLVNCANRQIDVFMINFDVGAVGTYM